jgi:hypothetical protein
MRIALHRSILLSEARTCGDGDERQPVYCCGHIKAILE